MQETFITCAFGPVESTLIIVEDFWYGITYEEAIP